MTAGRSDDQEVMLASAIVLLGTAVTFHFLSLDVVGIVLVVTVLWLLTRMKTSGGSSAARLPAADRLIRLGFTFQVALGSVATLRELIEQPLPVLVCALVATVVLWVTGLALLAGAGAHRMMMAGVLVAAAVLAVCWLTVPARIDVFVFQDVAAERLVEGTDPYRFGYPNYYSAEETARIYGPGLSIDGELQAGFPYPPLSLLLSTAGWLAGDPRFAHAMALLAATLLLMTMADGSRLSRVAGLLLITSPMAMHVVRQSWTEPFVIAGLVALLWTMRRERATGTLVLGLFLAVKQYVVIFLPVIMMLAPTLRTWREKGRVLAIAALVGLAATVPFVVWHPSDFFYSVVLWQLDQPFRTDAMSVPSVLSPLLGVPPPWLQLALVATAVLAAIVWSVRLPRTWASVARGGAVVMLAFLLVNKQAFTNYYMVAIAAICCSLSLLEAPDHPGERVS